MKKILLAVLLVMAFVGMAMAADVVPVYKERKSSTTELSGNNGSWVPEGVVSYNLFGGNGIMVTAGSKITIPSTDGEYEYYGMQSEEWSYWRKVNKYDYTEDFLKYMTPKKAGASFTPAKNKPVLLFRRPKTVPEEVFWKSVLLWWHRDIGSGNERFIYCKVASNGATKVLRSPKTSDGDIYVAPNGKGTDIMTLRHLVPLSIKDFMFLLPPGSNQFKLIDDHTAEVTPVYDYQIPSSVKCEITRDGQPASTKLKAGLTYQIKM